VFLSHEDLTNAEPPIPGLGEVRCLPLTLQSGVGALRDAVRLGRIAAELLG